MRRRYRLPLSPLQRAKLICFFIAVAAVTLGVVGALHLRELLGGLAATRVSNMVNSLVVSAVQQAVDSGEIQYDRLITLQTGADGKVTALQSNMAEFNRLQSAITQEILTQLDQVSETDLSIPLGTLTGSALLSGRGPRYRVRMESTGSCAAHFENQFSHAGINQTTHSIVLFVDVDMNILLPGVRTSALISNAFSVAETVIVGDVPDSYTYFDSGNAIEEDAFEYSINKG